MKYRFIDGQKGKPSVRALCHAMRVSESGYYSWRARVGVQDRRTPSNEREVRSAIARIHRKSRRRYGRPRICEELRREGFRVGSERVRRIMRELSLEGRSGRLRSSNAPKLGRRSASPNLINRNFDIERCGHVWVGDITQVRVKGNWHYLAVVINLSSRRVVGWNVSAVPDASLATRALKHATRGHKRLPGLIFHSDQGQQYLSTRFRDQLRILGIHQSMSRRGNCWDNAVAESFFATLKKELTSLKRCTSTQQLRIEVADYVRFYNSVRLHSTLGYTTPNEYEARTAA